MSIWNRDPALIPFSFCANNKLYGSKNVPGCLWEETASLSCEMKGREAWERKGRRRLSKGRAKQFLSSCFNCIWPKLQIYLLATKADWLVSSLQIQIWETTSPYSLSEGDGNPSCSLQGCLKTLLYLWERGAESNLMGINSKHAGGFNPAWDMQALDLA